MSYQDLGAIVAGLILVAAGAAIVLLFVLQQPGASQSAPVLP